MRGSSTLVPYWSATAQSIACVPGSSDAARSWRLLAAGLAEDIATAGGVVFARPPDRRRRDSRELGCEAAVFGRCGGRVGGGGRGGGGGRRATGAGSGWDRDRAACAATTASTYASLAGSTGLRRERYCRA